MKLYETNLPEIAFIMKKTLLAALLAAGSASALASQFYVVVPVPSRTATAGNILVTLNPYGLPGAVVGRAYAGFDFNSVLQVKGDPSFSPAAVRWSLVGGALPAGLALDTNGKLTGMPTAAGTSSFQVMASYKTKAGQLGYQVVVGEVNVGLSTATLPTGVQGASYFYDLKPRLVVTGDPAFNANDATWSLISGALPAGLHLNADGTITGVPTVEGTHPFTVQASYLNKSGQQAYAVIVGAISVSLGTITPPTGVVGQAYSVLDLKPSVTIQGDAAYAGGGAGVTWSLAGGTLPAGLALDASTGVIAGTPTARGTGAVQVKADYKGKSATQSLTISLSDSVKQFSGYRAWSDGTYAKSCKEYRNGKAGYLYQGTTGDGIYRIDVDGAGALAPVDVLCDMTTSGGGWTVFQNRYNGAVDFYRTWVEYANGFGSAATEYWLGNDRIAVLTAGGSSLRIELARTNGETGYAQYSAFTVSSASDRYRLYAAGYSGTVGDSFASAQSGYQFSTKDGDNDIWPDNCAVAFTGAWWYQKCHSSNLNGAYLYGPHASYADGMEWASWTGAYESMAKTSMKLREN
ncbi:hypothetical protein WJ96_05405 [Burkholderia ubonensis]|uniref:Fibrinogen C-terminal domain-containing protein n=2 Tax=Burkholderia ubonensis TaxID=101571 RepID=A0AAW3MVP2_9BURK|nr:hypothetical protein WJ96_05405 [Burkholderia ubonensis]KVZ92705.1 hypothetical protein WL25_17065 [Burkholderia ubonensis]